MAGVNKVILVGNLGADPESRSLNNGGEVVNLRSRRRRTGRTATATARSGPSGTMSSIFNENLGRVAKSYLRKGSKVYLEGQIQTRKWTDQSGNDRYTTEIVLQNFRGELVLLDSREGGGRRPRRLQRDFGGDDFGGGARRGRSRGRSRRRSTPTSTTTSPSRRSSFLELGEHRERARLLLGQHARFLERRVGARAARIGIEAERQRVRDRRPEIDRRAVVEDDVAILLAKLDLLVGPAGSAAPA